jgi:ATP-dependent Zn protease
VIAIRTTKCLTHASSPCPCSLFFKILGPPGSGKTLLAQAVAGEANVPFFACSASEFVEVYVGRGAARIRALFSQARRAAVQQQQRQQNKNSQRGEAPPSPHQYIHSVLHSVFPWLAAQLSPLDLPTSSSPAISPPEVVAAAATTTRYLPAASILFIDELDALGKSRQSSGSNDEREQTLNQLLTELDGFGTREREFSEPRGEADEDGGDFDDEEAATVIVIAATNRVDVLDPAILRRFDRQIHVGYPATAKARKDVLLVHARRVRCGADVDWDRIASDARTLGCSGADLANLVNEAALLAVREGSAVIQQDQLDHAARRIQSMKWREDHPGELLLGLRSAGIR